MKALVLSGGRGTRLRPITHTSAKQLIPVANKPILYYVLEVVSKIGIDEVGIIVGDTKDEIISSVGDGSKWNFKKVVYIQQEKPLGIAHAVKISEDFLGKGKFLVYLGDNILSKDIGDAVKEFEASDYNAMIFLCEIDHPERFGVVEVREGRIVSIEEKPKHPKSNLALVGVYMFDHNVFKFIKTLKPSWRGELEITDAIRCLIDNNYSVKYKIISGWWKDTGKLEDLLDANRFMLDILKDCKLKGEVSSDSKIEGKVSIGDKTKIVNSKVRGPTIIGENVEIIDSYIGPYTSIFHGCRIENSEVENSIILGDTRIIGIRRLEGSLIGRNVEILKSEEKPQAHKIMVGDHSKLEIV